MYAEGGRKRPPSAYNRFQSLNDLDIHRPVVNQINSRPEFLVVDPAVRRNPGFPFFRLALEIAEDTFRSVLSDWAHLRIAVDEFEMDNPTSCFALIDIFIAIAFFYS